MNNLIIAKTLIVDDKPNVLRDNEDYLNDIDDKKALGIAKFDIEKADSLEKALRILNNNVDAPFNIVLLDLNLEDIDIIPSEIKGLEILEDDYGFSGFTILRFIKSSGSAEYVIVVSAYPEQGNMLKAFRLGANDFIQQPCEPEELQKRFSICWLRLMLDKSQRIFDQRISDLVPYAEKGLASMFTKYFYNLADEVVNNAEDLKTYIQERYGLEEEKDAEDTFFQRLHKQKSHLNNLLKEWEKMQNSLQPSSKSFEEKNIGDLLKEIHQSLLPCLIVKNLELELLSGDSLKIKSSENDVSAVFREIVIGALGKLPNQNETNEFISINVENIKGQVIVRFQDNLEPISKQDAKDINRGAIISSQSRFEREWGLSVVQHIAIRGGGRLEIEPLSQGNIVNYYIPSA